MDRPSDLCGAVWTFGAKKCGHARSEHTGPDTQCEVEVGTYHNGNGPNECCGCHGICECICFVNDIWQGKEPGDYSGLVAQAGPCRLGKEHTKPGRNGMVYCEHGVSVYACHHGCTDLPPLDPVCESCGRLKDDHTEDEAAYCIVRAIAEMTDEPVYVAGLKRKNE